MAKTAVKQEKSAAPKTTAKQNLIAQFKAALRCGTPLVAITTADQFATVQSLVAAVNSNRPFVAWDVIRGFAAYGEAGRAAINHFVTDPQAAEGNLAEATKQAFNAPEKTVLFVFNAQRYIEEAQPAQALCNLRDVFKGNGRCVVLVGPQITLPAELAQDVVVLDEPLPGQDELQAIVKSVHESSGVDAAPEVVYRAVEAVQGLSAFAAEQVTAMSMARNQDDQIALDMDSLWDRKRKQIEQTPGLSVNRDGMKFADLGGLETIKLFMTRLINGNGRPNAIVFIDEIEKMLAGSSGDTSGVSADQLGTLLSYMADNNSAGVLLVGHPGSGKSAMAKAVGNEAGVPTIKLDLGAAKGGIVGESERKIRDALKVVTAVSNGSTLWVATSNGIQNVPPEMRARFKTGGPFFFDLPNAEERKAIWKVHRARFNVNPNDQQPQDDGWVGREIEQCCELAWRLNETLTFAAQFVAPISQAAPDKIEALRQHADGKWLSASHPGFYRAKQDAVAVASIDKAGPRKMDFNE